METYSNHQIEQFLKVEIETICSIDHAGTSQGGKFWDGDTISSGTITTSMTSSSKVGF